MPQFYNFNGKMVPGDMPAIGPASRGFRYGDGVFETLRAYSGGIRLGNYHFDRLERGLALLKFDPLSRNDRALYEKSILDLCRKNGIRGEARIRLSVFRADGGLYDPLHNRPQFFVEAWELPSDFGQWNENGLDMDIYPDARKVCDAFSSLKSLNYLPYLMAARFARDNKLNDALLLNQYGRVCDSSIANIWWIKGGVLHTVPLGEGCVAGVMRQALLDWLPETGLSFREKACSPEELLEAEEVFVSNALRRIRWVKQLARQSFGHKQTRELARLLQRHLDG